MKRAISHSEVSVALDCFAKWDFGYGGRLAGTALKRKTPHVRLREGRAWGRAVAELHSIGRAHMGAPHRLQRAHTALRLALDEDAEQMREHGVYSSDEHHDMEVRLGAILWHYYSTSDPLQVHGAETELLVPLPSRTGVRTSSKYTFHGFLDGLSEIDGRLWIVEYKLRDRLMDYQQVVLGRQYRRYAWAAEQQLDQQVAGVIVDERLNEAPKPARWVKGKKKTDPPLVPSHAKDQLTTGDLYRQACLEARVEADPETFRALESRAWQARHSVLFRRSEIEEAGRELVAAAQVIAQLDTGALWPIRNPSPQRCGGCPFREICPQPDDEELVDLEFERVAPKRLREEEVVAV